MTKPKPPQRDRGPLWVRTFNRSHSFRDQVERIRALRDSGQLTLKVLDSADDR